MGKVNDLLATRTKKKERSSKMTAMAEQSATGNLSSFSGIFSVSELSEYEKEYLEAILSEYSTGTENLTGDLRSLIAITSEVKAINNQAAILHGERIKKAQTILTRYKEGAFTAWLVAAYGNRQTPYNFLQYYEFWDAMPMKLRTLIEQMPRQAIYTLASRTGPIDRKIKLIENYNGETKSELLYQIREEFPLSTEDRRAQDFGFQAVRSLEKLAKTVREKKSTFSKKQKKEIEDLLEELLGLIAPSKKGVN